MLWCGPGCMIYYAIKNISFVIFNSGQWLLDINMVQHCEKYMHLLYKIFMVLIWLNMNLTGMADIFVKLIYHHQGKFVKGKYQGGKIKVAEWEFGLDLLSYPNLLWTNGQPGPST